MLERLKNMPYDLNSILQCFHGNINDSSLLRFLESSGGGDI